MFLISLTTLANADDSMPPNGMIMYCSPQGTTLKKGQIQYAIQIVSHGVSERKDLGIKFPSLNINVIANVVGEDTRPQMTTPGELLGFSIWYQAPIQNIPVSADCAAGQANCLISADVEVENDHPAAHLIFAPEGPVPNQDCSPTERRATGEDDADAPAVVAPAGIEI